MDIDSKIIEQIRQLANISEEEMQDKELWALYLVAKSVNGTAAIIWRRKAARYAELVDITEGSSSRKLSSLYSQALAMANSLGDGEDGTPDGWRPAKTRAIVRP